ncbi:MAG: bifunctional precorrin-2 dehydrogenase/sirohydrochlorin ferrochelatase [Acidimicrobiia bacterium]
MTLLDDSRFPAPISHTYPINVIVRGQACLVVGGGRVAEHKVRGLQYAEAHITVVAPWATAGLATDGTVTWRKRTYRSSDVSGHRLVVTATGDTGIDTRVASDARRAGVLVNSADDPQNCDFILPAVARAGDLTVSVSTASRSPAVATWLRKRFESELDWRYRTLLDVAADVRAEVRLVRGTSELPGWGEALDDAFELIAAGDTDAGRSVLRHTFGLRPDPIISRHTEELR